LGGQQWFFNRAWVRAILGYGILFLKPAARFKNKTLPRHIPRSNGQLYFYFAFFTIIFLSANKTL
jgi:hypothetical protein